MSRLTANETNRRKSLILVDGSFLPCKGGVAVPPSTPNALTELPSLRLLEARILGNTARLPFELVCNADRDPGSISNEDKKDVLSSSPRVLVTVRKVSRRSFCSARAVPFISRTFTSHLSAWKILFLPS